MKKTVYLDSTIPSYYCDIREELKTFVDITKLWWKTEKKNYNLYISESTIAELSFGEYPNKKKALNLISNIELLKLNFEIKKITDIYIKELVIPKGAIGDASHLAYASYYKIDYLLTWNCNHLANANKSLHIQIINTRIGVSVPRIITPMELFTEKG